MDMDPKRFMIAGPDMEKILRAIAGNDDDDENHPRNKVRRDVLPAVLAYQYQDLCRQLTDVDRAATFKVGDLITWKAGMRTHKWPVYGEPVVVTAVLPEPLFAEIENKHGTPYWREPLDIKIGWITPDTREFLEFYADSRRYRLWTQDMMEEVLLD